MAKTAPMAEIRAFYAPGPGRHWFDKPTMRFFGTLLPAAGKRLADGTYVFLSRETMPSGPHRWTVRHVEKPGRIRNVGQFATYVSRDDAKENMNDFITAYELALDTGPHHGAAEPEHGPHHTEDGPRLGCQVHGPVGEPVL